MEKVVIEDNTTLDTDPIPFLSSCPTGSLEDVTRIIIMKGVFAGDVLSVDGEAFEAINRRCRCISSCWLLSML